LFKDLKRLEEEHAIKSTLAIKLFNVLARLEITHAEAAFRLGITQQEVSRLKGGNYSHFTAERMLGFFNTLDQRVEIRISPTLERRMAVTLLA
jgi:predicted XRE-type DNA-binding protein